VIDMWKTVLLVLAGLGAGLAIAVWLQPSSTPFAEAEAAGGAISVGGAGVDDVDVSGARLAALEDAFAAEVEKRVALEAHVAELEAELDALGERPRPLPNASDAATDGPDPAIVERRRAALRARLEDNDERTVVDRLVSAGFAPDRAEWINRRTQELRMQTLQAQYEARRDGRPQPSITDEDALRTELGDADYERFLTAMGRSTTVNIDGVLAGSPAERSGLQPGDEIVAYNGTRVFDIAELNELTLGGATGESVVVEVRRNGQSLQLVMPRGPIGIWGGFRGPPVRVER
jgi:membrane-associated protease RseP (regulator of RpoE activity)